MTVLLVVIGILSMLLMPLILRTQGPMRRSPLQATWLRFLRRLERAGIVTRPSMGARLVAMEAGRKFPGNAEEINRIAGLYNRYRYSPSPPSLSDFKHAVKAFRPTANLAEEKA